MKRSLIFVTLAALLCSCIAGRKSIGNTNVTVFANEAVNFNPEKNKTSRTDTVIKIDNGRIILKKVKLPVYTKHVNVILEAEVVSAGDPWDKTGSLFVIPASSRVNFLLENDTFKSFYKKDTTKDSFPGVIPANGYEPAVEILRFMTPFGVGFYSNDPKLLKRKPVYIPKWEEKAIWIQDVTQLVRELQGEVWIGAFIDVWTKEGYKLTAKLRYEETKAAVYPQEETKVIPLVNTTRYIEPERLYDGFSRKDLEYSFTIPEGYSKAKLYYTTTGHGGHDGGDEFVQRENIVTLNGEVLYKGIPWRDDCASFRRFNPHSGVWTEKRVARTGNLRTGDTQESEIDEFIASSDYSRSNWCPGSKVEPFVLDVKGVKSGMNTLRISIPAAQPEKDNELNHWNVSAYIVLTK